jgi:hypothetical protein
MHGLPVGAWFEMRSLGKRGARNAAIGALIIVMALPLSLTIASMNREVPLVTWVAVLLLAFMVSFFLLRALAALHLHRDAYVTSISFIFDRRPDESRFRDFADRFFNRMDLGMKMSTIEGLPRYTNGEVSLTILSAGNLAGIGGFSMKDHSGDNTGVLNAFHRAATSKFGLDPHVRNGKRVGGRRTRR